MESLCKTKYCPNPTLLEEDLTAGVLISPAVIQELPHTSATKLQARLIPKHHLAKHFWQDSTQMRSGC